MKVATNMFCSEGADLLLDAKEEGLELKGIVCPFIELPALKQILEIVSIKKLRIITDKGTIGTWYKQFKAGIIPGKDGDTPTKPQSLDWMKSLIAKSKMNHNLKVKINGKTFSVDIHIEEYKDVHMKLYVFDKGFVNTSANITDAGILLRHLEMGVLVTEKDNKLQVEIIKQWFEDRWKNNESSCLAIRVEKTMYFAKKIIENVLEKEINANRKKHGNSEFYFSNRLFCFGCDECRNGKIIKRKLKFENKKYEEIICTGCDKILNKIRKFMPNVIQEISHEGRIIWRISKKDYNEKNTYLYYYELYDSDELTVSFDLTDDGSIDKIIQSLIASKIEDTQICLSCGNVVKLDHQWCSTCGHQLKNNVIFLDK